MNRLHGALAAAMCATSVLMADPAAATAGEFPRPPAAALKELKATVGRPFSAGYVFVNGRYIPPPYKVERQGTVIRINGIQVTRELIPWNEFIKTQAGVKAEKTVIPGDPTPAPAAAPEPPPEEPAEEETEEATGDIASNLDDLFNDNPTPKKKTTTKKRVVRRPVAPRPKQPTVITTYSFDGEFVHNEKTRLYLEKINNARTRIDKTLRMGGYFCFGSGYSTISGNASVAQSFIDRIPPLMQRYNSYDAFASAVASSGFGFLPAQLVQDLFRNRIGYRMIEERKKAEKEKRQWSSLLGK